MIRKELWRNFVELNLSYSDGQITEQDRLNDVIGAVVEDFKTGQVSAGQLIRLQHAVIMYRNGFSTLLELNQNFKRV